jgi:hypothetical protein
LGNTLVATGQYRLTYMLSLHRSSGVDAGDLD